MSHDPLTKVTTESWGNRLSQSFRGIAFGAVLFIAALALLFWNEGRAVDRAKALAAGGGAVVEVAAGTVSPVNEGRLVYVNELATTSETLSDADLGVAERGVIRLRRTVEMFQWIEEKRQESREKLGGARETVTTTSYRKDWSPRLIDSASFAQAEPHRNPPAMPLGAARLQAGEVRLGAFRLNSAQIAAISREEPLILGDRTLPARFADKPLFRQGNTLFIGRTPAEPVVGDLRVTYTVVKPQRISVVAGQRGDRLVPYETATGSIALLQHGDVNARALFNNAEEGNATMTWVWRLAGFALIYFGLRTLLAPLRTLTAVVPLVAGIVDLGSGLVALVLAGSLSAVTIAVAWLFARPMIGVTLLVIGVGLPLLLKFRRRRTMAPAPAG